MTPPVDADHFPFRPGLYEYRGVAKKWHGVVAKFQVIQFGNLYNGTVVFIPSYTTVARMGRSVTYNIRDTKRVSKEELAEMRKNENEKEIKVLDVFNFNFGQKKKDV